MNDRQFRQHIALLVDRKRREAETQAQAETARQANAEIQKKPPASVKPTKKTRKRRSA